MLNTSFENFRDIVLADEAMQKDLRGLPDRKEFIARVVELSREHGFELSSDDIENEMRLGSRVWTE